MENIQKEQRIEISKESFSKVPESAGVYIYWQKNKPIYVGKSVNLRSRLKSYLLTDIGVKTSKMIESSDSLSYIKVFSELESLLLESYLIKKYKPKYNIVLKDDKHSLYIAITDEEFPKVFSTRRQAVDNLKFKIVYGPFPSSTNVKNILKMVRKIFPYSDHKVTKKPCLYSHLGLCNPCPSLISSLQDESEKNRYKQIYLRNIRNIRNVLSRKFSQVRNSLEKEMYEYSKIQNFEKAKEVRDKISLLDYITQKRISETDFLENPNLKEDLRAKELAELEYNIRKYYTNISKLERIECFDIAHLAGSKPTASMVVLVNGEKDNTEYRHFKVKQKNSQSDYDSMREIVKRRVKNLSNWGTPNLVIVDGGLGQLKIFNHELQAYNIPVVGIAKHPDRLILPDGQKIVLKGNIYNLVTRIRDEAHRFARRLHHKLITKSLLDR